MNLILREADGKRSFYIVSVYKEGDKFTVRSKNVAENGKVLNWNHITTCDTLKEAEQRAKTLVIIKRKMRNYENVPQIPFAVQRVLVPPMENQVSADELLREVRKVIRERYVIVTDNTGLEESFDIGIEYVGYLTKDENLMEVYDKFGEVVNVLVTRFSSIRDTEQAIQARDKLPKAVVDAAMEDL